MNTRARGWDGQRDSVWQPTWTEHLASVGMALASLAAPRLGRAARRPLPLAEECPVVQTEKSSMPALDSVVPAKFGHPRLGSA